MSNVATTRRRTSLYALRVPAHVPLSDLLDAMISECDSNEDITRSGAWPDGGTACIMFRATDDAAAIRAAERMGGNTHGARLHTGLGVNYRVVAVG